MLSTCNLSAAQAENYFVKDDYYTEEAQHEASFWWGKGAGNLGLTGTVEKAVFGELLSGVGPNGEVLSGKEVDPQKRRAATDFTFSAPKSVSVAALVQQDERVLAAHHQAVAKAMSVLEERYAQTRISTDTGRRRVTTGNVIAAVFPHATNREAEPQLHSHCVVMNATQLPDGRWFSFANEGAIANKKLMGQIYQNELAIALQQHGYAIKPRAHGQFELAGYSPELLKLFSTRRQQIESLVALWEAEGKTVFSQDGGVLRSRLAIYEAAALKSRKRKPTPMQPEQLRQGWNGLVQLEALSLPDLPEAGVSGDEGRQVGTVSIEPETVRLGLEEASTAIEAAVQHCGERNAVFRQTALERFVFEHQLGQTRFDELQGAIALNTELVQIDDTRMTTQAAIQLELETIRLMREGKGRVRAVCSLAVVGAMTADTSLTAEQRQAIERVMTAPDTVMAWQGSAGVGKTFALNEVRAIARSQGFPVRGFAPSAEAAHTLGEALSIEAGTVAGLLVSQSREAGRALWIVDEAGLLSMRDAHALLVRAQRENARVLLVGDTKQLSAVEAGNPFKSLQAGGMTVARLESSLRQKAEVLKVAVQLISDKKVARGIDVLEQAGCLRVEGESSERIDQMVSDYLQLSDAEREGTLLLAGTNQARLALTERLRRVLQAKGGLGENALTFESLRRKDLTRVQARYLSAYELGDVLVPTQDYKKQGLVKHQQYRVVQVDVAAQRLLVETASGQLMAVNPASCERKAVYAAKPISVAVGDRLRWTKNDRAAKTRNGQQFVVADISPERKVFVVDGQGAGRWFDLSGRRHVDYAWVSTTYGSQGKTAERVLALMDEKTVNRESFYVTVSRAKRGLALYVADRNELLKRAQVSRAKENASDYVLLNDVVLNEGGRENAETQKENECERSGRAAADDGREVGERIGSGLAKKLAGEWAARAGGFEPVGAAGGTIGTGDAGADGEFEPLADIFDGAAELLSRAIAEYVDGSELIECEGAFEGAVAAVSNGFEQLERAAQNRNQLTAATDRLDTAIGEKVSRQRVDTVAGGREEGTDTSAADYEVLWQRYRLGVAARSASELDYRVGRRAFEDGVGKRGVALMLTSKSAAVRQIRQGYGRAQAVKYVNQMADRICRKERARYEDAAAVKRKVEKRQVEME